MVGMSTVSPLGSKKQKTSGPDIQTLCTYKLLLYPHDAPKLFLYLCPKSMLSSPLLSLHLHAFSGPPDFALGSGTPAEGGLSWSLLYQMDRAISSDPTLRKAAQQVCGMLAGSSRGALLWVEVSASPSVCVCACVCLGCSQDAHGWFHNSWTLSVRGFKEAHITHSHTNLFSAHFALIRWQLWAFQYIHHVLTQRCKKHKSRSCTKTFSTASLPERYLNCILSRHWHQSDRVFLSC